MSSVQPLVDAAGRHRSPATMPAFRAGRAPRNKGQRYPADPPQVDEIVAVMRIAGQARYGARQDEGHDAGPLVCNRRPP